MSEFTESALFNLEDLRRERHDHYRNKAAEIRSAGSRDRDNPRFQAALALAHLYEVEEPDEIANGIRSLLMNRNERLRLLERMGERDMAYIALAYMKFKDRYDDNPNGGDKRAMKDCHSVLAHFFQLNSPAPAD